MRIEINRENDGVLLRSYLKQQLKLSSKMLAKLKNDEEGLVVNGKRVTVRYVLHTGDVLTLMDADRDPGHAVPTAFALDILYEDEDLVAVNKPPAMPTHPSHGHLSDTLANALVYRYREMGRPFVFRPVSRLDRNTSGVVLVAKNKIASARLSASMQKREIEKTYLAILTGAPPVPSGTIETGIVRVSGSLITRRVCDREEAGASYACTRYETLSDSACATLVSAHPETGRTHQLRVHFAHLGCPILGDDLYGEASPLIPRQALHAASLTFPHPATGLPVTVRAPLPPDFQSALAAVGIPLPTAYETYETYELLRNGNGNVS